MCADVLWWLSHFLQNERANKTLSCLGFLRRIGLTKLHLGTVSTTEVNMDEEHFSSQYWTKV